MKRIKQMVSVIFVMALLLSLSAPAFAGEAEFQSTQEFLSGIGSFSHMSSTLQSVVEDSGGNRLEEVKLYYNGSLTKYPLDISAYFTENGESMHLRAYNVLTLTEEGMGQAIELVNLLNAMGYWPKFYIDLTSMSIVAEMDVLVREGYVYRIGQDAISRVIRDIGNVYTLLGV